MDGRMDGQVIIGRRPPVEAGQMTAAAAHLPAEVVERGQQPEGKTQLLAPGQGSASPSCQFSNK